MLDQSHGDPAPGPDAGGAAAAPMEAAAIADEESKHEGPQDERLAAVAHQETDWAKANTKNASTCAVS